MRVLIIGGTGAFTSRVTELAVCQGHEVMVVARGQRKPAEDLPVRTHLAERKDLRAHAAVFAEFTPEVVVDSICFDPDRAEDLVALFAGVRRVVLVSTVDVYGEDIGAMPVGEDREPRPVTAYARNKLACERIVLDGLGKSATVFRPSHILGRGFLTASLWGRSPFLVDRLRKGKAIPAIDGGRNLMTPVHSLDAAHWVLRSFDNTKADGQVFNAVGATTIAQRDYYECIAQVLGVELELHAVPSQVFKRFVESPSQFNWHRPYSGAKAATLLGYTPRATPLSMMEETVRHMLEQGLVKDCAEQPIDDALIELAQRHEAELGCLLEAHAGKTP